MVVWIEPQRTIRREQEVCRILSFAPPNLVDLFLNLERFKVIELWFVRLKLGVELVFAALFLIDQRGCKFRG